VNRDAVDGDKPRAALVQFIKFGLVGFSNTAIAYAIYSALVYMKLHYLIANLSAFAVSVLNSFFWNNKYVFKRRDNQERNLADTLIKTYVSYAVTGLALQSLLLIIFVDVLHISKYLSPLLGLTKTAIVDTDDMSKYLAQLLGLTVTVPLNFVLNKKWAFKS
jgi:putative flippase GtrA